MIATLVSARQLPSPVATGLEAVVGRDEEVS